MRSSKITSFFESFIVFAILLVLVQTFMEDFTILRGWTWPDRKILVFTGFAFDVLFTIEFLVRIFYAVLNRKLKGYLLYGRGWVDFIASVPLLMFNSGPALLSIVAGGSFLGLGGFLNVLKVVKAIRIARILRLLRVLKIFRQIKYADSQMAQRHVSKVTSVCISVFVFGLFFVTVFSNTLGLPTVDKLFADKQEAAINMILEERDQGRTEDLNFKSIDPDILLVKLDGSVLYNIYSNEEYSRFFGPGEYRYEKRGDMEIYFNLHTLQAFQSKDNIIYFMIIVVMVIIFLIYYSPHFAITVTDPIHVMKKGFENPNYNLAVKVPENYKGDDVFELAVLYNDIFLPMKDRNAQQEDSIEGDLRLEDMDYLFEPNEKV